MVALTAVNSTYLNLEAQREKDVESDNEVRMSFEKAQHPTYHFRSVNTLLEKQMEGGQRGDGGGGEREIYIY